MNIRIEFGNNVLNFDLTPEEVLSFQEFGRVTLNGEVTEISRSTVGGLDIYTSNGLSYISSYQVKKHPHLNKLFSVEDHP